MISKIVEATNNANWGKFLLQRFDEAELSYLSVIDKQPLVRGRGWTSQHLFVMDLQTGEGAMFRLGGVASADLEKHRIWVCPLYEPFLTLLYENPGWWDLRNIPVLVSLPGAPAALYGHRRKGPSPTTEARVAIGTELARPKREPRRRGGQPVRCERCEDQKFVRLTQGAAPTPCPVCRPSGLTLRGGTGT